MRQCIDSELLIDPDRFMQFFDKDFTIYYGMLLIVVRQDVKSIDNQKLKSSIEPDLFGLL